MVDIISYDDYDLECLKKDGALKWGSNSESYGKAIYFKDKRNEHTLGTYTAFVFCAYGFLAIIALVTVLNIVNSISMSVYAPSKRICNMSITDTINEL